MSELASFRPEPLSLALSPAGGEGMDIVALSSGGGDGTDFVALSPGAWTDFIALAPPGGEGLESSAGNQLDAQSACSISTSAGSTAFAIRLASR